MSIIQNSMQQDKQGIFRYIQNERFVKIGFTSTQQTQQLVHFKQFLLGESIQRLSFAWPKHIVPNNLAKSQRQLTNPTWRIKSTIVRIFVKLGSWESIGNNNRSAVSKNCSDKHDKFGWNRHALESMANSNIGSVGGSSLKSPGNTGRTLQSNNPNNSLSSEGHGKGGNCVSTFASIAGLRESSLATSWEFTQVNSLTTISNSASSGLDSEWSLVSTGGKKSSLDLSPVSPQVLGLPRSFSGLENWQVLFLLLHCWHGVFPSHCFKLASARPITARRHHDLAVDVFLASH